MVEFHREEIQFSGNIFDPLLSYTRGNKALSEEGIGTWKASLTPCGKALGTGPESEDKGGAMATPDCSIHVKQEPGMETMHQSSTDSALPLFPKTSTKPTTTIAATSSVASSGTPVAQAGAAAAAAAIAMSSTSVGSGLGDAPMFNGFGGLGGFFNAAAFAAAAAAAFPNGGITAAVKGLAPKDSTNPLLGLTSVDNPPTSTPPTKRRKRGRAEERPNVKPGDTPAPSPLMKVEAVSPQLMSTALAPADGVIGTSNIGTAAAASAVGGGIAWMPGMMNVLTQNSFGVEISNQERKVRVL